MTEVPTRPRRRGSLPPRHALPDLPPADASDDARLRLSGPRGGGFSEEIVRDRIQVLPIGLLSPNPDQPRRRFNEERLRSLATSIAARGVLQPLLVQPSRGDRFEIIAGERRWRASRIAGRDTIPVFVRATRDDQLALELALIENVARESLTIIEEARSFAVLLEDQGATHSELAERTGKSRADISNIVRLLRLPDEVLDLLDAGRLTKGHGKVLAGAPSDTPDLVELASQAARAGWSVRRLEDALDLGRRRPRAVAQAPDAVLVARAAGVERRTGASVTITPRGDRVEIKLLVATQHQAEQLLAALDQP